MTSLYNVKTSLAGRLRLFYCGSISRVWSGAGGVGVPVFSSVFDSSITLFRSIRVALQISSAGSQASLTLSVLSICQAERARYMRRIFFCACCVVFTSVFVLGVVAEWPRLLG